MRILWKLLHEDLMSSIRSLKASRQFKKLKAQKCEMAKFKDPVVLVSCLASKGGDLDEKDAIYAALVEMGRSCKETSDLAKSLLWLGLWPGLDAVYRRELSHFPDAPEELVSEIGDCFTDTVQRADLSRINRVAATLIRNTERKIIDERKHAWAKKARRADMPKECLLPGHYNRTCFEPSDLGLVPGLAPEEEVAALRQLLVPLVGDNDADLVIGAAIYEELQCEVGERLGLTHEAARKRYRRALDKIRKHIEGKK